MSQIDDEITQILKNEGGYVDNPADKGGPTAYGIAKNANPDAWKNGPPTEAQARQIYFSKYVVGPGFDKVSSPVLQAQLVDFGVNSGPSVAVSKLQEVLGLPVDGILGPHTLATVNAADGVKTNNALVVKRILMIGSLVSKNPTQAQFALGWLRRALEFLSV